MTVWTLSGFGDEISDDPGIQFAVLQALGASHVEVRSAWGVNALEWDDAQLNGFADAAHSHAIRVSALASPIGKSPVAGDEGYEVARLTRAIEIARSLDTPFIRIFSFYPEPGQTSGAFRDGVLRRLSLLAELAERSGVVLLHENEKGIYGDVPERVLDIVESVGSESLRLAWDSANFVQVGVRPFSDAYPLLREHIAYLQVKDASATTLAAVPAGEGDGEMLETLTALRDEGYVGFASLEPHLPSPEGTAGFAGPIAFGRAARAFRQLTDAIGVHLG